MVQREVADRFFAQPRTKAYGAVSVLVQLATRKVGFHPVPPTVFRPRPRVESALVAFVRVDGPPLERVKPVVEAAFAHRRKTLANSVALSALAPRGGRGGARGDRQAGERPRRGARAARVRRARRRAAMSRAKAYAKLNLALVVGPLRPDGKHEVATVLQAIDLHDDVELEPADELAVEGFAEDTLVRAALEALAAAAGVEPRWRARIEKRIPVAAGLGGGSSDAAAALRLANELLPSRFPLDGLHEHRRDARRGRAVLPSRTARSSGRATARSSSRSSSRPDYAILLVLPENEPKASTAEVYERFDERGGDGRLRAAPRPTSSPRSLASTGRTRPRDAPAERPRVLTARRPTSARWARSAPT